VGKLEILKLVKITASCAARTSRYSNFTKVSGAGISANQNYPALMLGNDSPVL
jgi:hypothetical protein